MQGKNPTLAKRYLFKLLANVASVPVYLAMEAILPRALGPKMYGSYSFATNLFYQMAGFLDMGTSTCFYNSLSRRQTESGLIAYYMRASLLVLVITMAVAMLFFAVPSCGSLFMPDVPLWLAPLAAFWAFLTWWGRVLRSMNDAIGATVSSEMVRTVVSLVAVVALGGLFFFGLLDIGTLFLQQYCMLACTAIGFWFVTVRYGRGQWLPSGTISMRLTREQKKAYFREFFDYSNPLFVQALLAFFMLSAERWLLQWFDGSAEQGFFALSQKVSMACFLFVSAMTPLLMRELSIAWGRHDVTAMAHLVNRFAPLLYVVAAYFPASRSPRPRSSSTSSAVPSSRKPFCPCRSWPSIPCTRDTASLPRLSSTPVPGRRCSGTCRPLNVYMASPRPGSCLPQRTSGASGSAPRDSPAKPWACSLSA